MGVSFKISKSGTRYRFKPTVVSSEITEDDVDDNSKENSLVGLKNESLKRKETEGQIGEGNEDVSGGSSSLISEEASFTLNLYPDGYSIGKPSEAMLQDAQKLLHPYDRASESLFSAIESGRLPGDILEDLPCKYINGTLVCELRDYRNCASGQGLSVQSLGEGPTVIKVRLKMSLENVVKDIPLISDNSWTYGDLMEVESRILKALQPQLCLDPTPKLDRLCKNPVPEKLNLALSNLRRKRLRQMSEVAVTSNGRIHGKKVCIDRVPESSNSRFEETGVISGNVMPQHAQDLTAQSMNPNNMLSVRARNFAPDGNVQALVSQQSRYSMGVGNPRSMQEQGSGSLANIPSASSAGQDMMITYGDNVNSVSSLHGKRENQDGPMSPVSSFNKRARLNSLGTEVQPQTMAPNMGAIHVADMNWKNPILQQQAMARGMQFANAGIQKYPQQMFEGVVNQNGEATPFSPGQPGMRFAPKEEPFYSDKLDNSELSQVKSDMPIMETETQLDMQQSRLQQQFPHHLMRSNFSQAAGWNNISQDLRKDEQLQKRKSVQSPRLSAGALAQSPLSSKSGEFSAGSAVPHFGAVAATGGLGASQKDKSAVTSVPAVGGTPSLTSSANDSLQRQHQAQAAARRRSNSLPKTPAISGVASPASVSNISVPLNANSPSVGTPPMADQSMLERFAKIEMITMRHQLHCKKNKVDDHPVRNPKTYSPQNMMACFSALANNNGDFKDDDNLRNLSKSLIGGSINVPKMRVIEVTYRAVQGNVVSFVPRMRARMIMSQKPSDGTVAMHYGETEDGDILAVEDYLPALPNTHSADLLAAQFCSLMMRDGYNVEDHIQPKPVRSNNASNSQLNTTGVPLNKSVGDMQQYNEATSVQPPSDVKPNIGGNQSINPSHNLLASSRMLPPGNPQALQMSQGLLSGVSAPARPPQQLDPQGQQQSMLQHQVQQQQTMPQQQLQQNQHPMIQQQHSQFQRSQIVLPSNPLSQLNAIGQNSTMQLGNHMVNKASPLHLQMLQQQQQMQPQQQQQQLATQQQQQQQQQPQMQQRKMMMGLGNAMGMGNISSNMVGLGGLGHAMGIGGGRGLGGPGISGPMTPMSGMSNVGQNPINLGQTSNINAISQQIQQLSSGQMTPQHAQYLQKLRMMTQPRNLLGGSQSGIAGMTGRQMHPGSPGLSMLGQSINRGTMNPLQRGSMGPMGPPKLMQNLYMNQQQPQQQLQLQQQSQQQQQQQQLQMQQLQQQPQQLQQQQPPQQQLQQQQPPQQQLQQQAQETTSPLQTVVSPSQVGSPSAMAIPQLNQQPQQQPSPQQMSQRTPMSPQLSSGAIHPMSAGNPEACPASPQLSSQTLGSVGSITNSPMDLQGVNNSNSASNA